MKKSFLLGLQALSWIAVLMPIGFQYTFSAFLVFSFLALRKSALQPRADILRVLKPIDIGVLLWAFSSLVCNLALLTSGDELLDNKKIILDALNLFFKQAVWWLGLSRVCCALFRLNLDLEKVMRWLAVLFGVYFLYLLGQHWWGWDLVHGFGARLGENRFAYGVYRLSGFMGHALSFAHNLLMFSFFLGALLLLSESKKMAKTIAIPLVMAVFAMVLSGSRLPTFALLGGLGILFLPKLRQYWKIAIVVGVALMAFIYWEGFLLARIQEVFSQFDTQLSGGRMTYWKTHWQIFLDHPLFGAGYTLRSIVRADYYGAAGISDPVIQSMEAHNIFLQTLADAGIVGFLGLVAALSGFAISLWRTGWVSVSMGLLFVLVLTGMFQNTFRDSEFLFALFMLSTYFILVLTKNTSTKTIP